VSPSGILQPSRPCSETKCVGDPAINRQRRSRSPYVAWTTRDG
jgi:hypothetical protein